MGEAAGGEAERAPDGILVVSARRWFASALEAVLEPEGFSVTWVRSGNEALRSVSKSRPALVLIDEGLADLSTVELCQELIHGLLDPGVPIVAFLPGLWHEQVQADVIRAGAWEVIHEPTPSELLVARLRRLIGIERLLRLGQGATLTDPETGLYSLSGLLRTLPLLGGLADRYRRPLSCAVLGPTRPKSGRELATERRESAELCLDNTRMSDVCAWLGATEIAVVAYDASLDGVTVMARRLADRAESRLGQARPPALSAGIVEFPVGAFAATADRIAGLAPLASARDALRLARREGGGILTGGLK